MRRESLALLLLIAGCAGGPPAQSPQSIEALAPAPAGAQRRKAMLDEIVRIELERNCFGPATRPTAPESGPGTTR
jgi:hypothetical protein